MAQTYPTQTRSNELPSLQKFLSVEQYLNTTYRPDVDYVDGEIEERNLGDWDHGNLQLFIGALFLARQKEWGVRVAVESRVRVSPTRVRIPDVCVVAADMERERKVVHRPPLLCVEVLSPRDSLKTMRKRVQDFLDMGVKDVWIFDPETRTAHACTATTIAEHKTGTLRVPDTKIALSVEEIFSTLDA